MSQCARVSTSSMSVARAALCVVTVGGDNYSWDQAIWAEATLIGKDGKIVATDLRGGALEAQLDELLK